MRQHAEILKQARLDLIYVLGRVLVGHVGRADVKLEVRPIILKVVVVRQLCHSNHHHSLPSTFSTYCHHTTLHIPVT